MTRRQAAAVMSDDALRRELKKLDRAWNELNAALEASGGASGSPGEWIYERQMEIETELQRREKAIKP